MLAVTLLYHPASVCGEKHQRFEGGLTEWFCSACICSSLNWNDWVLLSDRSLWDETDRCSEVTCEDVGLCMILLCAPEHEQECGTEVGVDLSFFSSDAGLVSMLSDMLLLFREISVRPSSRFISSHNHELSKLSYSSGSACRQVSVSTAAELKYLLNPSSLFNYLHVLEKWCKPSCIYDMLPTSSVMASTREWLVWTMDAEQRAEQAWNGLQVRNIKSCLNWQDLKV